MSLVTSIGRALGSLTRYVTKAEYSSSDFTNIGWSSPGAGGSSSTDVAGWLLKYRKNPRLRAAISRIARDVAKPKWHLGRVTLDPKTGKVLEKQEIYRHDFLTLWARPHPRLTGTKWRALIQSYLDTAGECFIMPRYKAGSRIPKELWVIPPHWVVDIPTATNPAFTVVIPGEVQSFKVPVGEILWLTDPDLYDPYGRGRGVAQTLDDEVSQDEWAAKWNNGFFRNGARPDVVITVPGADEKIRAKLRADWESRHQGFWNSFKTAFLSSDCKVQSLGKSHQELDFWEGRRALRDIIFQTIGPLAPEVMGVVENSNRATADAALYLHGLNVVEPRLEFLWEEFSTWLLPRWNDPNLILWYDCPVRESEEFRLNKALEAFSRGVITRDECRRELNWDELLDERGQEILAPSNMTIVMPGAAGSTSNQKKGIIRVNS